MHHPQHCDHEKRPSDSTSLAEQIRVSAEGVTLVNEGIAMVLTQQYHILTAERL